MDRVCVAFSLLPCTVVQESYSHKDRDDGDRGVGGGGEEGGMGGLRAEGCERWVLFKVQKGE